MDLFTMKLIQFQVKRYRSVRDSGKIDVTETTSLLGRNECGKTNLLRALAQINSGQPEYKYDHILDFPIGQVLDQEAHNTAFINTIWELNCKEKEEILKNWPKIKNIESICIERRCGTPNNLNFQAFREFDLDKSVITENLQKISNLLKNNLPSSSNDHNDLLVDISYNIQNFKNSIKWSSEQNNLLVRLYNEASKLKFSQISELSTEINNSIKYIDLAINTNDSELWDYVIENFVPKFYYFDEFDLINGRFKLTEFLERRKTDKLSKSDVYLENMCKVAEINLDALIKNLGSDKKKNKILSDASEKITKAVSQVWDDRKIRIRFSVSGDYFFTKISDSSSNFHNYVNLNERGYGFRQFFSIFVTLLAHSPQNNLENCILLLDEPGLHLHAEAQNYVLKKLFSGTKNQILYTTHSPFLVPVENTGSIRLVEFTNERGTEVSNELEGNSHTLFPLQAAIGYDLSLSLFVGPNQLVVEGIIDYWILSSISQYLNEVDHTGLLEEISIIPAGTASKIPQMVSILAFQNNLKVVVLFDSDEAGKQSKKILLDDINFKNKNIIFVSDALTNNVVKNPEIEDLLEHELYLNLVRECYSETIDVDQLTFNMKIPKICSRFEDAFKKVKKTFEKSKPAKLFLDKIGTNPKSVLTPNVIKNFTKLFALINERFQSLEGNFEN